MKYRITINEVGKEDSQVKAYASVIFGDSIVVRNIAIVKKDDGVFVSMPSQRTLDVDENGKVKYKSICNPITKEFKDELEGNILKAYDLKLSGEMGKEGYAAGDEAEALSASVSATPYERPDSNIKGLASIFLNDKFVINSVTIVKGSNGLFVSMPSYKANVETKDGKSEYRDIAYPITKEFSKEISEKILGTYHDKKNKELTKKIEAVQEAKEKATKKSGKTTKTESKSAR